MEWFFTFVKLLDGICEEFERFRAEPQHSALNDDLVFVFQKNREQICRYKETSMATISMADSTAAIAHYLKACQLMVFQGLTRLSEVSDEVHTLFQQLQELCRVYINEIKEAPTKSEHWVERRAMQAAHTRARECLLVLYLDNRYQRRLKPVRQVSVLAAALQNLDAAINCSREDGDAAFQPPQNLGQCTVSMHEVGLAFITLRAL